MDILANFLIVSPQKPVIFRWWHDGSPKFRTPGTLANPRWNLWLLLWGTRIRKENPNLSVYPNKCPFLLAGVTLSFTKQFNIRQFLEKLEGTVTLLVFLKNKRVKWTGILDLGNINDVSTEGLAASQELWLPLASLFWGRLDLDINKCWTMCSPSCLYQPQERSFLYHHNYL